MKTEDETEKERTAREAREARQDAAKKKFYGREYKPDVYKKPVTLASEKARRTRASVDFESLPLQRLYKRTKAAPPDKRTEGVRMGEFDLDRIESAGKDKPSFAVMVDSNGKEHNIELEHGQKRPSKAQLRELKERLARKSKSVARGEAFRQRALERKRRHTEETGTSSMKLR
tara:strand:+ start:546 stop:1064 length:519 start_codon:yes stop_codon:yes gene_type:complete